MKKQSLILLAVLLTLALCLSLSACNGKTVEQLQNEFGALLEGGKFEEGSVLNFDAVDSTSEEAEDIFEKLSGISAYITDKSKAFIYDISVTKDGKEVQPDGTVKLTIPVPQGSTETDFTVFHVKDSGEAVKIAATYADGKLSFETDGFSYYVIVATTYVQNTPSGNPSYGKYQHKLTVTPAAPGSWYIEINGERKDASEGVFLNAGETHVLELIVVDGWRFDGWYDADTNELLSNHWHFELVLNENRNLVVKLTEAPRRLEVTCDVGGRVTVFGADNTGTQVFYLEDNDSVTLTAVTNEGYEFDGWVDSRTGEFLTESENLTITMDGEKNVRARFKRKTAAVSFTVSPAAAGYFELDDGTTCTEINENWELDRNYDVCAVANIGYRFVCWKDQNGIEVTRSEWLSGTVPSDGVSYQAVFEEIPNQLTVTATEGGKFHAEVLGDSKVNPSFVSAYKNAFLFPAVVELEAEVEEGYRFVGWFDERERLLSNNLEYSVYVDGKVKIEAKFEKDEYTLIVYVSPAEGGYVTENGVRVEPDDPRKIAAGTNVTLTAVPNDGYVFVGWYHNGILGCEDPTLSCDMIYDIDFEARFVKRCTLIVTVEPAGSGYITENDQKVDYSVNGKQILLGENVDLTAEPMDGYQFVGWFDATTGEQVMEDNVLSYTMDGDRHLIARFKPAPYELEVDCADGGKVEENGAQYSGVFYSSVDRDASVTLKALPSETYEFVGWYDKATSVLLCESAEYSFVMDGNKSIQARFKRKSVSVSIVVDPANSGYFELLDGSTCTEISGSHEIGECIEIKAVAYFGYRFVYWENVNTKERYEDECMIWDVPADGLQYRAVFEEIPNQLTVTAVGGGKFMVAEGDFGYYSQLLTTYQKAFDDSERIRLCAKADEGYRFAGWFIGNMCVDAEEQYSIRVNQKVNLRAVFVKDEYYLSADVYTEGSTYFSDGGYITEDGERVDLASGKLYAAGTRVTLTAVENDGYVFVGWLEYQSDGGYLIVSEALTRTFILDHDQYFFACFEKIPTFGFLAQVSGEGYLTENGQIVEFEGLREVQTGTKITLTAVPRAGYRFKGWSDATVGGEAIFSTTATCEFTVTKPTIVTAIFEQIPQASLTITTNLPAGGSVTQNELEVTYSSGMLFDQGTEITLQAIPADGYRFVGWYDAETGDSLNSDDVYDITLTENMRIEARFELIPPTTYRFLLNLSGNGSILQNGVDVTEDYIYGATFEEGTRLTLKAVADDGNRFVGWYTSDNVLISADAEYTFVLNGHMSVRAVFEANPTHRLLLTIRGNGEIHEGAEPVSELYANGVSLPQGTTVVLTAVADEDSQFVGWYTSDGTLISAAATYIFEMNADIVGYAKFEEKTVYHFVAYPEPFSGGYLEENSQIVEFGNGRYVTAGTKIKLTAVANEGYAFKGWGTRDENWSMTIFSTEETYEFIVNADTYVYAVFEAKVTGIELDAYNAGFTYETIEGLGLVLADKTVVQIGAQNLPDPENVVVYAVKADGSVALDEDDYTIDLGGLDFTKEGVYTITYTYVHDTSMTATLTVEVKAAPNTGLTEAEWNAAIAYWKNQTNVKAFERTVTPQSYDPQYGAPGADIRIYQLAGNAYSSDGYMEDDLSSQQYKGKTTYLVKQGNKYYRYTWDDGEWNNELGEYVGGFWKKGDYNADIEYNDEIRSNIYGCRDSYGELIDFSYANFTYDAETKSYKNSDGSISIAFTFDDNKELTQIVVTQIVIWESGSSATTVITFTFGDAVVDVPTSAKCEVKTTVRTENSWDGSVGYITENGVRVEYDYDYVDDGTVITLTAVANDGYVFKRWAKEKVIDGTRVWVTYSTDATYTFTADGDYGPLNALFEAV